MRCPLNTPVLRLFGVVSLCLLLPSGALAALCQTLSVNMNLQVNSQPLRNARVQILANEKMPLLLLNGYLKPYNGFQDFDGLTNNEGKLVGSFQRCGLATWLGFDPSIRLFYRTDFNGEYRDFSQKSPNFTGTVNFNGDGSINFIPYRPKPKVKFRFPLESTASIDHWDFYATAFFAEVNVAGPFGVDHRPGERDEGASCVDYSGETSSIIPYSCYGSHRGTDFMLDDGFDTMDEKNTWIVAAADGWVKDACDKTFDRCSFADCDDHNMDCPSPSTSAWGGTGFTGYGNFVKITHGNNVESRYWHIKKGSLIVKPGDFVTCGQKIAIVGSSGKSFGPHLHFEVQHDGQVVDPYQGLLSREQYWVEQSFPFPATKCQDPKELYPGNVVFNAKLVVKEVKDLGILSWPPISGTNVVKAANWKAGAARWYKVAVEAKDIEGFNAKLVSASFTFPKTAFYLSNAKTPASLSTAFYVPIAPERVAALGEYEFDAKVKLTQEKAVAQKTEVTRIAAVKIAKPSVSFVGSSQTTGAHPDCTANAPAYAVTIAGTASGFAGGTSAVNSAAYKWSWKIGGKAASTGPAPLRLCRGKSKTVEVKVTDKSGVESASLKKAFVTPVFSASHTETFPDNAKVEDLTYVILDGWRGGNPTTTTEKHENHDRVSITITPADVGGEPFAKAIAKAPVTITWVAKVRRVNEKKAWEEISAADDKQLKKENGAWTNNKATLFFPSTDVVYEFRVEVGVTDGWGRSAGALITGRSGVVPNPFSSKFLKILSKLFVKKPEPGPPPWIDPAKIPGFGVIDPLPIDLVKAYTNLARVRRGDKRGAKAALSTLNDVSTRLSRTAAVLRLKRVPSPFVKGNISAFLKENAPLAPLLLAGLSKKGLSTKIAPLLAPGMLKLLTP